MRLGGIVLIGWRKKEGGEIGGGGVEGGGVGGMLQKKIGAAKQEMNAVGECGISGNDVDDTTATTSMTTTTRTTHGDQCQCFVWLAAGTWLTSLISQSIAV